MMDEEDFGSDSSDEDYIPDEAERGSEEEVSGDEEDLTVLGVDEDGKPIEKGSRQKKKTKAKDKSAVRKRTGGIKLEGDEEPDKTKENQDDYNKELAVKIQQEQEEKKNTTEKKKADDLWADFMKDVGGPKPKPKPASTGLGSLSSLTKKVPEKSKPTVVTASTVSTETKETSQEKTENKREKITITKEYDFAGEIVKITKEVDADSKEAKSELKKQEQEKEGAAVKAGPSIPGLAGLSAGLKRPGGGGLSSVLGKIGKKPKMGTLEKSKLDWEGFKQKEGISEELQIHNRGKEGYIERMNFLQRTDLRQFEIEKDIRNKNRTKNS